MNLVDFLITYVAIGAAFAMRAYFRHRHRPNSYLFRSVAIELAFWLPKWAFRSVKRVLSGPVKSNVGSQRDDSDFWYIGHIDALVRPIRSSGDQKRLRKGAERYAAIRTAIRTGESGQQPDGQFELFEISGHRNNRAGTTCLYRKNLAKLRHHSRRSAEDLIKAAVTVDFELHVANTKSNVIEFFDLFDDVEAVSIAENFEFFKKEHPSSSSRSDAEVVAKIAA